MTRARNRLFVHIDSGKFDCLSADRHMTDEREYAMPTEIMLQLSHKDVYLDYFKGHKREILSLRGGDPLAYEDSVLYETQGHRPVARLSKKMQAKMAEWEMRGYRVKSASVRFVVAWKPKDAPREEAETAVLLVDLALTT